MTTNEEVNLTEPPKRAISGGDILLEGDSDEESSDTNARS